MSTSTVYANYFTGYCKQLSESPKALFKRTPLSAESRGTKHTPTPVNAPLPPSILLSQGLPQSKGSECVVEGHDTYSAGVGGVNRVETITSTPSSTSTSLRERRSERLLTVATRGSTSTPLQLQASLLLPLSPSSWLPLPNRNGRFESAGEVQTSVSLKKRKRRLLELSDTSSATDSLFSPPSPTPSATSSPPLLLLCHATSSSPLHSSPLLLSPSSQNPCSCFESSTSIPSNNSPDLPPSPHVSVALNTTTSSSSSSSSSSSVRDSTVDSFLDQSSDLHPVIVPACEPQSSSTDLRSLCCPVSSVCEYVKAVCRKVFPLKSVWGTRHNLNAFLSAVDR